MKLLPLSIVALFVLSTVAFGGTVYLYNQFETQKALSFEMEKEMQNLEKIVSEKDQLLEKTKNEFKEEIARLNADITSFT